MRPDRDWLNPGYEQTDDHPVVCLDWEDAKAYVEWLSGKTGKAYRLLSEAEWEYVARAGTRTARYWGEDDEDQCRYANGADVAFKEAARDYDELAWFSGLGKPASCSDGYVWTAPVRSFSPNEYGLHDVLGNVHEMVGDCLNESYVGAPADGSTWESGKRCDYHRMSRGGSWNSLPYELRFATRGSVYILLRYNTVGFRVARTLTP